MMTNPAQQLAQPTESKRIRKFRDEIVKAIPKFPNDRTTRDALLAMSFPQLMIHYLSWQMRLVRPAKRAVTVDAGVTSDSRYPQHKDAIAAFLAKVEAGEDLTPYLSLDARKKGFNLAASGSNPAPPAAPVDRWADKDFLLNVMGYHHFHLGTSITAECHAERTNEVLFAQLSRTTFEAIALLDHSVFHDDPGSAMTPERTRLWNTFNTRSAQGIPPGTPYITAPIALSGHPIQLTFLSMEHMKQLRHLDTNMDDRSFIETIYSDANITVPKKSQLELMLNFMDFGLYEPSTNTFLASSKGWI